MDIMSKIMRLQKSMAETKVFGLEITLFQTTKCMSHISNRNTTQGSNPFDTDFYLNFVYDYRE